MTRRPPKSDDAFRTIREVSDWLEVPTHVLRFWESKFDRIAPVKGAGGRRYYRPDDMRLLGGIKRLLHDEGQTVRAVQTRLAEEGPEGIAALSRPLQGEEEVEVTVASDEPAVAAPDPAPPQPADDPTPAPVEDLPLAPPATRHAPPQPEPVVPSDPPAISPEAPAVVPEASTTRLLRLLAGRGDRSVAEDARRPLRRLHRRLSALADEIEDDLVDGA